MELKKIGLPLAIIIAFLIIILPLKGLNHPGHMAFALLVFAVIMWVTEATHLAVTSIIILFAQPILGIEPFEQAVIGFANPILFLMIGGFIIAEGIRKSGLVERLTYTLLNRVGTTSSKALFVSVFSTGILSAWIESVVAFVLVLPIIKEIVDLMKCKRVNEGKSNFAKSMILGACFASLGGGIATVIGTAPNLMAAAYIPKITFASWLIFGIPIALLNLFVIWILLKRIFPSEVKEIVGGKNIITKKMNALGNMKRDEKISLTILLLTIFLWVTTDFTGLNTYSVALIGASLFFLFKVIDWRDAQKNIDWGIIMFFGGALSLGYALLKTGAAEWLVKGIFSNLGTNLETFVIVLIFFGIGVILTQVMSNIALSAILVPLSVTLASAQNIAPEALAIPVAFACSLAFILPTSDPTLAISYTSGYIKLKDMIKAGIPVTIAGIIIVLGVLVVTGIIPLPS